MQVATLHCQLTHKQTHSTHTQTHSLNSHTNTLTQLTHTQTHSTHTQTNSLDGYWSHNVIKLHKGEVLVEPNVLLNPAAERLLNLFKHRTLTNKQTGKQTNKQVNKQCTFTTLIFAGVSEPLTFQATVPLGLQQEIGGDMVTTPSHTYNHTPLQQCPYLHVTYNHTPDHAPLH